MQTLIMGLAGLAGKVTDSYPALDVKAGIIPEVCMCARGGGGREGGGRRRPEYTGGFMESLITGLE